MISCVPQWLGAELVIQNYQQSAALPEPEHFIVTPRYCICRLCCTENGHLKALMSARSMCLALQPYLQVGYRFEPCVLCFAGPRGVCHMLRLLQRRRQSGHGM